ncbi:hypothetical protein JX266_000464 [Neoarthrinium moseri]|nr:hypothetical protein JX266_000464 [Neoarthrinium moseri]
MDPVTIVTTAATVVGTAIKVSKSLYDAVEALKDAPADVRSLCATVNSVKSAVGRLVGFMRSRDCDWPDGWLEGVAQNVEAIGDELTEVEKLVADWNSSKVMGKMGATWRSFNWYFNADQIAKSTRRLRDANADLLMQVSLIQVSTTAKTSQDLGAVKNAVSFIKEELTERTSGYNGNAFSADLAAFAEQMSSLKGVLSMMNSQHVSLDGGHQLNFISEKGRDAPHNSFISETSEPSSPILSPLAALNQQAYLQNQQLSNLQLESESKPLNVSALGLKLSELQRKHEIILHHCFVAQERIMWLEELQRAGDDTIGQFSLKLSELQAEKEAGCWNKMASFLDGDLKATLLSREELEDRDAIITTLQAQNEGLQDMINQRITLVGYEDGAKHVYEAEKKLLKKGAESNRLQEEVDLLRWRLKGVESSLREQLKVNQLLGDEVKVLKSRRGPTIGDESRKELLTPDSCETYPSSSPMSGLARNRTPSGASTKSYTHRWDSSFLQTTEMHTTMAAKERS